MPRRSEAQNLTELGDFVTAQQAKEELFHLVLSWAVALFSLCHGPTVRDKIRLRRNLFREEEIAPLP